MDESASSSSVAKRVDEVRREYEEKQGTVNVLERRKSLVDQKIKKLREEQEKVAAFQPSSEFSEEARQEQEATKQAALAKLAGELSAASTEAGGLKGELEKAKDAFREAKEKLGFAVDSATATFYANRGTEQSGSAEGAGGGVASQKVEAEPRVDAVAEEVRKKAEAVGDLSDLTIAVKALDDIGDRLDKLVGEIKKLPESQNKKDSLAAIAALLKARDNKASGTIDKLDLANLNKLFKQLNRTFKEIKQPLKQLADDSDRQKRNKMSQENTSEDAELVDDDLGNDVR
jgi:hypothetical protein